jgi:hypothetical protein
MGTRRNCRLCKKEFSGRSDKIFCSIECKNDYHVRLRQATHKACIPIDRILHRNRSILLEIMGKNSSQKKVKKTILDKKKFNYSYCTGFHINKHNKTYRNIYDFAWMEFSDGEILIIRRST